MKNRQGQITLYIILGLVIIAAVSFILLIRETMREEAEIAPLSEVPLEARPVNVFVEECLKDSAIEGIYLIGYQGGYLDLPPETALFTENDEIAYYYSGRNVSPSTQVIEDEILSYIEETFPLCIDDFSSFNEKITAKPFELDVKIAQDSVKFMLDYPLTIIKDESKNNIRYFVVEIPVRFGHVYDISQEIVGNEIINPGLVDMSLLTSFDAYINVLPYDGENVIYTIYDNVSMADNVPFVFRFANKLSLNQQPFLEDIPLLSIKKDALLYYDVNARDPEGDELEFYSPDPLLEVDPDSGMIVFMPDFAGAYPTEICVKDPYGSEDCKEINIYIEET